MQLYIMINTISTPRTIYLPYAERGFIAVILDFCSNVHQARMPWTDLITLSGQLQPTGALLPDTDQLLIVVSCCFYLLILHLIMYSAVLAALSTTNRAEQ